ncbi:Nucleotide-diphospho-sugar transferase family protein [Euphorbia peplus]|nr:Nucleotide-diphospho-sugar transferase family protein [Euphorbia peplus]
MEKTWARNGSIVDLFLESYKKGENTRHLLNHLVIVVLDVQSLQYCQGIHPHCFYLHFQTAPILNDSIDYPTLHHIRNQLLLGVLHLGYNLVYTEADVMWLRNPFPLFDPGSEVTLGCDSTSSHGNAGFFYVRANLISIDFLLMWNLINVIHPATRYKSVCEIALYEDFKRIDVDIRFIDTQYYGGFCDTNKDISNIYTMRANCCPDLDHKIHDLNIFLDFSDYKEALVGRGATLQLLSAVSGKTPMKCFSTQI